VEGALPVALTAPVIGSCESRGSDNGFVHRQEDTVLISVMFPEELGNLQRHEPVTLVWLLPSVLTSLPCRMASVVEGSLAWNWSWSIGSSVGYSLFGVKQRVLAFHSLLGERCRYSQVWFFFENQPV